MPNVMTVFGGYFFTTIQADRKIEMYCNTFYLLISYIVEKTPGGAIPSEQHLSRLTDFVSYLEN